MQGLLTIGINEKAEIGWRKINSVHLRSLIIRDMKVILIIKHIDIEGPGTLGSFLIGKGFQLKTIDLGQGELLPEDTKDFQAVVCLGGPMNVYEEEKYPFLKEENIFIKKVLAEDIPFLGICLGAQLLAKASGAKVVKSPVKEIGFFNVELTKDGQRDILFKGIERKFGAYHWHEDMFEIPTEGSLLATARGCPHQAFKIGKNTYGLQFHVEVTDKSIREWANEYLSCHPDFLKVKEEMLATYKRIKESFNETAQVIYNNFLELIRLRH